MWPQKLSDLNPVDYAIIWYVIQLDAACKYSKGTL